MSKEIAIKCEKITKTYTLFNGTKQKLLYAFGIKKNPYKYSALKDINISINKEEIVGIIGLNGSGKSTLARIITGITAPDSGEIIVNGKVNMLAANAGLFDYLTGIENIQYKCTLMGMEQRKIKKLLPDIIDFADLGEYINYPIRTYSSGMRARLGFSIAISDLPDILFVDEALSVGDMGFAERCRIKMQEIKQSGKTVIFVSHSVTQMKDFCDRIIWMHNGEILADDCPENLILPYCAFAREYSDMTIEQQRQCKPDLEYYNKIAFPHKYKNIVGGKYEH